MLSELPQGDPGNLLMVLDHLLWPPDFVSAKTSFCEQLMSPWG